MTVLKVWHGQIVEQLNSDGLTSISIDVGEVARMNSTYTGDLPDMIGRAVTVRLDDARDPPVTIEFDDA